MAPVKTLLSAAVLLLSSSTLDAQWLSRFNAPLPPWADSALTSAGFWGSYDLSSRTSPQLAIGDLDGDGLWDVAVAIVARGVRKPGIAIVHQIDRSVHIVGAGQAIGNGRDELPSTAGWNLEELLSNRAGVHVVGWHTSAWLVWNGARYVWVPETD